MCVLLLSVYAFVFYRYLFRSGNAEHPSDKFYNTTVEVLPENPLHSTHNVTSDGYVVIGKLLFSFRYSLLEITSVVASFRCIALVLVKVLIFEFFFLRKV